MELGFVEFTEIAKRDKRKTILNVIARNDKDNVPPGFVAVYLRDHFWQVLPDELIPQVKEIFYAGFEWDVEQRWIKGHADFEKWLSTGYELDNLWLEWAEINLRNDG